MDPLQRPGLLAHTKYGEPLNRRFLVEAGSSQENDLEAETFGDGSVYYYTGTIGSDTFVNLKAVGARVGLRWTIIRLSTSGGPFSLVPRNDDASQLAIMNAGDYIEAMFDGTRWVVVALGTGVSPPF